MTRPIAAGRRQDDLGKIGLEEQRAVELRAAEGDAAQIGRAEIDAIGARHAEIGADQQRHAQAAIIEIGADQPRLAEVGMRQVAAREHAIAEIVKRQVRLLAIRSAGKELLVLQHDPVEQALLEPDRLRREEGGA